MIRAAVVQLAKLVPPTAMASDWQQYLNAVSQLNEDGIKLTGFARLGDAITTVPLATTMKVLRQRFIKIARRDGFKACSTV
jgi:hypothetical protein